MYSAENLEERKKGLDSARREKGEETSGGVAMFLLSKQKGDQDLRPPCCLHQNPNSVAPRSSVLKHYGRFSVHEHGWYDNTLPSDNDEETLPDDTNCNSISHNSLRLSTQHSAPTYYADPLVVIAKDQVDPFSRINCDGGPLMQKILHHCKLVF